MRNLIRKEILFVRKRLAMSLVFVVIYLAFFSAYIESHRAYLVLAGFMGALMMPVHVFGAEDRYKVGMLTCSLPFRRATIVLAKHIVAWGLMAFIVILGVAAALANPYTKFQTGPLVSIQSAFQVILFMSIVSALMFPFIVRFGFFGVIIFLVASQLAGIVFFGIASLTHSRGNPIDAVMGAIEGSFRALMHLGTTPMQLAVMLAAAIGLSAVSLRISQALYARREM